MPQENDIFGQAISDYFFQNDPKDIDVYADDFEKDTIPTHYLFRKYAEMPKIEQIALQKCKGKILDVGCGAGSHMLELQQSGKNIKGIDISPGAIEICKKRGLKNTECIDFFELKNQTYDCILMLMNGIGFVGKIDQLKGFFDQLKKLLHPNGQVLLDSSDLKYLYEEGIDLNSPTYYGEIQYQLGYKKDKSEVFNWLYLDFESLAFLAELNGFVATKICDGPHYDYLAKLTLASD
ncbi:MAG: class I SAM-dependent methyltransferase [Bacteroidota bacterium]